MSDSVEVSQLLMTILREECKRLTLDNERLLRKNQKLEEEVESLEDEIESASDMLRGANGVFSIGMEKGDDYDLENLIEEQLR